MHAFEIGSYVFASYNKIVNSCSYNIKIRVESVQISAKIRSQYDDHELQRQRCKFLQSHGLPA
jgi:hypothetical protein